MDLFVVPTISFRLLYGLLILHHDRRQILWLGVTAHPTAEWISRQLTEAYGWKVPPRYIWARILGTYRRPEADINPIDHVSTSYAERSNLTVRMHTRRFTRLTNGFSKKVENHAHSVALFAMYYNFVRIHKTLRTTPAMAAKVTERLWEIGDIVGVLEAWEAAQVRRSIWEEGHGMV